MINTINPEGKSNHVVLEAFINNKWRFFDPLLGFVFYDDNNELVSYEDIYRRPSLFYLSPPMLALKQIEPDKYENIKNFFIRNIFYKPAANVIRLNPVKTKDLKRRVITKILDFYVSLFGKAFSYFYQDVYLRCFASVDSAAGTLFRGRNYDLFGRYNFAINMYKKCIDNFMEDKSSSEKALFWLGVLYGKIKNFELSIDIFRTLLKKYPRTKWRRIAHYCLGYDYELLGKYELAKKYYWQGVDMYRQLSKNSIQSGEIKIIRRLHNLPKQIPR